MPRFSKLIANRLATWTWPASMVAPGVRLVVVAPAGVVTVSVSLPSAPSISSSSVPVILVVAAPVIVTAAAVELVGAKPMASVPPLPSTCRLSWPSPPRTATVVTPARDVGSTVSVSSPSRPSNDTSSNEENVTDVRSLTLARLDPRVIVSLSSVPRSARSSVADAPVSETNSIPAKLVVFAVSGVWMLPESLVDPGDTVVVPAAVLAMFRVSLFPPPSMVSSGPPVPETFVVSSPSPAETTRCSVLALTISAACSASTVTEVLAARMTPIVLSEALPSTVTRSVPAAVSIVRLPTLLRLKPVLSPCTAIVPASPPVGA